MLLGLKIKESLNKALGKLIALGRKKRKGKKMNLNVARLAQFGLMKILLSPH